MTGMAFAVGAQANAMMREKMRQDRALAQELDPHQVPILPPPIPIAAGAGVLFVDGPGTGQFWGIRRLTLTGFSAGSVAVFKNSQFGEEILPAAAAGTFTFGRGEQLLMGDENLVFVAAGITLTAANAGIGIVIGGAADFASQWQLAKYLI